METGTYIQDGTATWITDDARDGVPVGDVVFRPFLKRGYLKANGATVNREDYPRLVQFATDNDLWSEDNTIEPWKFGTGDGSTTMTMPNYIGQFIEGGESAAKVAAGLPNITGGIGDVNSLADAGAPSVPLSWNGAMRMGTTEASGYQIALQTSAYKTTLSGILFNAAYSNSIYGKSSTVQPPAITLIPQIKY